MKMIQQKENMLVEEVESRDNFWSDGKEGKG